MPGFITDENGNLIEFTGAKVKSELLSYDLIIRTQNDFDDFCNNLTNGTCTARSVLFVGDGGTLEFVKADGLTIDLLFTNVKKISGIKNAIINIQAEGKSSIIGLRAEADVDNITLKITGARLIIGFAKFTSATNLTFIGECSDTNSGPCIGFQQCNNIINCLADCTSPTSYVHSYKACTNIINSKGVISSPLSRNNIGSLTCAFYDSTNLSNVEAIINEDTPNAYGFFYCENISNYICTHGDTYLGDTLNCTNVSASIDAGNLTEENVASWQEKLGGKVLWENANPTAEFGAQTITLASADYDFLLIQVLKELNNTKYHNFILAKGQSGESSYTNGSSNSEYRYMTQDRVYTYVSDTSYSISANSYSRPSAYVTDRQDLNIPIRIIGFKGVRND